MNTLFPNMRVGASTNSRQLLNSRVHGRTYSRVHPTRVGRALLSAFAYGTPCLGRVHCTWRLDVA